MYNNILVKSVERHFVAGMADKGWVQISLEMKNLDPNSQYDFKPSYDSKLIGSPPTEGDYINFDIEEKTRPGKSTIFNITEWKPSTERSNGSAASVGDTIQTTVSRATDSYSAFDKEADMFAMGFVGRFAKTLQEFPKESELEGWIATARNAFKKARLINTVSGD
jgi:hypothetical protein